MKRTMAVNVVFIFYHIDIGNVNIGCRVYASQTYKQTNKGNNSSETKNIADTRMVQLHDCMLHMRSRLNQMQAFRFTMLSKIFLFAEENGKGKNS